ncbi:unnamed protein product [Rhizopus microsporus]
MNISSGNTLIATCSADKSVKLWVLGFGDCHKSIFAHQESIMSVQFVWGTDYFFTVSRDKTMKYWDGDKHGSLAVTGSHDMPVRIWKKTEEQLFLEVEYESIL